MNKPGIEITPVHTFMDERTNATFYSDVRVEDKYRLGEINGGAKVLASALSMEQSGGYYHILMREMADTVADWAREEQRDGKPLIENDGVLARLAKVYADARISEDRKSGVEGKSGSESVDIGGRRKLKKKKKK